MERHERRAPRVVRDDWLSASDPAEKAFMDLYGREITARAEDSVSWYTVGALAATEMAHASNELHAMCLAATEHVLRHDALLQRFGVPLACWDRVRRSWAEGDRALAGRFDLACDGHQIKMLEYNADSAAALLECARVQDKWAGVAGCSVGVCSGEQVHTALVDAWKAAGVEGRVHLFHDDDPEEIYTALYMRMAAEHAGLECAMVGPGSLLPWRDGRVVDADGVAVRTVWKTWLWTTVWRDSVELAGTGRSALPRASSPVRLADVLMDERTRVLEPMWKAIPSNKGILAVLWSLFPNHPYLLRADWDLTNDLERAPYVRKPLVGRCGGDVTICAGEPGSAGGASARRGQDVVYQELFRMPCFDGHYPILGSWIVGGKCAGFVVRDDQKPITDGASPIRCCRIV